MLGVGTIAYDSRVHTQRLPLAVECWPVFGESSASSRLVASFVQRGLDNRGAGCVIDDVCDMYVIDKILDVLKSDFKVLSFCGVDFVGTSG